MRILHIDASKEWRGGQNQALLTASGMAASGHAVTLLCRRGGALAARAQATSLSMTTTSFRGELSPAAIFRVCGLLRRLRPDVVQAHDPPALAAAALAARVCGYDRVIATRRVDFRLRSALSRWKYSMSARVIAVSRAIASALEQDGVPETRIRIVYEGVPDRPALPDSDHVLKELGMPEDALLVGNIAALTDHKDHATLLEAAALVLGRAPAARFVILGEGECRTRLERRIDELGLGGRVVLAGFRADVDRFWPSFAVFCLSSHMEGLGTSLMDAMVFGRPIVATDAGGIPEAVEDGVTGRIVPRRRPDLLADALVELLLDPERRASYGREARRRYERLFSDRRMVAETLRVYEELT